MNEFFKALTQPKLEYASLLTEFLKECETIEPENVHRLFTVCSNCQTSKILPMITQFSGVLTEEIYHSSHKDNPRDHGL